MLRFRGVHHEVCRPVERKCEAYHGSVTGARLDQALPLQLLGAVLHAGQAVSAVHVAVELVGDAVAVVLHDELEVAVADPGFHRAVGRAAVFDDVAGGLAQDALVCT